MEAIEGFATEIDGTVFIVRAHHTLVAAGHPLVKHYPQHFRPVQPSDIGEGLPDGGLSLPITIATRASEQR